MKFHPKNTTQSAFFDERWSPLPQRRLKSGAYMIKAHYIRAMVKLKASGVHFMLISTACFAVVNTIVKFISHFPVHELIFFRSLVSIVFCGIFIYKNKLPFWGNNKPWLITRGLFGVLALSLFFVTLQNMPISTAVSIQYLSPVFTILIATLFFGEQFKKIQIPFFLLALLGIWIIKGFDPRIEPLYFTCGVLSAFFSGIAYNAIRKCRHSDHPMNVVLYFPLVALPIMGTWCLLDFVAPLGWDWLLLLLMGVFTQMAQVNMTKALQSDKTSLITPLKYIGALFAICIDVFIFNEELLWATVIGMSVVIFGLVGNTLIGQKK